MVRGHDLTRIQVLVVDDEPTQRLAVSVMCRGLGLPEALAFGSGHQALATVAAPGARIDLVICDLDMPEMDGMEFIRRIAGLEDPPALMILSGHPSALLDSVERMGRAYGLRMTGSVRKPLTRQVLQATLTALSENRADPAADEPANAEMVDGLIASGRFEPYFQPQVALRDGQVCGAEVLARLLQPDGAVLLPHAFLKRLSERGMMTDFTIDIVDKTLALLTGGTARMPDIRISINLTPLLFDDLEVMNDLMDRVDRAAIPRDRLVFEVVETAVASDPMMLTESAARLRLRGFGLAIDDYGQGHASLDQLRRLPFDELKIDRAFVADIDSDPDNRVIVANTISMAKALGLKVVAEGVETEAEVRVLTELGCDLVQGFLYAPALPYGRFLDYFAGNRGGQV
ncbi:MAG: EAL domain-containing response regulator [Sneathiellaceae bacterium]